MGFMKPLYLCTFSVRAHTCIRALTHTCSQRSKDPLELELQVVLSCPTWFLRTEF